MNIRNKRREPQAFQTSSLKTKRRNSANAAQHCTTLREQKQDVTAVPFPSVLISLPLFLLVNCTTHFREYTDHLNTTINTCNGPQIPDEKDGQQRTGALRNSCHLMVVCLEASIWSDTPCDSIFATAAEITSPTFLPPASSRAMYSCCALTYQERTAQTRTNTHTDALFCDNNGLHTGDREIG